MRVQVFLAYQWHVGHAAGGGEDRQFVHGIVFALDADEARRMVPGHLVRPVGKGSGAFGELELDALGTLDVGDEIPVFLEA